MYNQNGRQLGVVHPPEAVLPIADGRVSMKEAAEAFASAFQQTSEIWTRFLLDLKIINWHINRPLAIKFPHRVRY